MRLMYITQIVLSAGILSSCVTDELVDPPQTDTSGQELVDGLPATLTLNLRAGQIETRAVGESPTYHYATADELYISECAIAIFDVDANNNPTTLKAFQYAVSPEKTATATDTLAWQVKDIAITTGKAYVLVVANLPEGGLRLNAAYPRAVGATFQQFKSLIATENFGLTFDPRTLVKAGGLLTNLSKANNVIEVPMTQLAAKVSLTVKVDIEPQKETGAVQYPPAVDNIIRTILTNTPNNAQGYSKRILYPPTNELQPGQTQYFGYNCKYNDTGANPAVHGVNHDTGWWNDTEYILWNGAPKAVTGLRSPSNKVVEIGIEKQGTNTNQGNIGFEIDSIFSTTYWNLHINSVTVNHIQTETDAFIEGFNTQASAIGQWLSTPNADVQDQYQVSFYTYEMARYTTPDNLLTIALDCKLNKQTTSITKHYKGAQNMHVVAVDTNGNITAWGSQTSYAAILISGFNNNLTEVVTSTPIVTGAIISKAFQVNVNDVSDLVHGRWYGLTTTMTAIHTKATGFDPSNIALLTNHSNMPWIR